MLETARHITAIWLTIGSLVGCSGVEETAPEAPAPERSTEHQQQVDPLVKPLLEDAWTAGMVVGLVDRSGTMELYGYGTTGLGDGAAPDGDTVFEIGSISKTFTSLALALAVSEGSVTLDQPVQEVLPAAEVTMPARGGQSITFRHLSTHTSALPQMPDNVQPANPSDPYADYGAEDLYAFLSSYALARDIGDQFEYSNVGAGLLGHALSLRAGLSYEQLVRTRVTEPLGLDETAITLSPELAQRFAVGHDADLNATQPWSFDVLAGAGALRSTAFDMLRYAAAQNETIPTDLAAAMRSTHEVQFDIGGGQSMGLGWIITDDRYRWHNGGTGGFGTFVGFDPHSGAGVVVLSNTIGVVYSPETQLGLALLQMMAGQPYEPPDLPPVVNLPLETLAKYAGRYEFGTSGVLDVILEEEQLLLRPSGQPDYRMFAEDDEAFYLRMAPVRITFVADSVGAYDSLHFEQQGVAPFDATRVP